MTKRVWIVAIGVVLATSLATVLTAQPPGGRMGRPGPGMGGPGMGPGPGGPMGMAPFGLRLEGLDLTDEQRAAIRQLVQDHAEANKARLKEARSLSDQLRAAILSEPPDTSAVATLKASMASLQAELFAAGVDLQTRIAAVLTTEQRATLREAQAASGGGPRARRRGLAGGV
jgi:Spy/CpxP family protein refolding chaperone